DTHCCKCKKSFCIYKLDNKYQCSTCRKGKAKQQINTNNGYQWKSTNNIDSKESVQQWNEFMKQEQNQPSTSYAQSVKQSRRNIHHIQIVTCLNAKDQKMNGNKPKMSQDTIIKMVLKNKKH